MQIQITTRKVMIPRVLRASIADCLATALERFVASIAAVHVELSDRNGRRGGGDKRCRMRLRLTTGNPVLVEDVEAQPKRAIPHAVARAQAAVRSRVRLAR